MFTKHTDYLARCAACDTPAVSPGSYYIAHPYPLTVMDVAELKGVDLSTQDSGRLNVYDGEFRCGRCTEGRTATPPGPDWEPQARQALTPRDYFTVDCDTCETPVIDGVSGAPLELPEAFLGDSWKAALRSAYGWEITDAGATCGACRSGATTPVSTASEAGTR